MEFGMLLPVGSGRWDEVARVAALGDEAGFDVLWVGDHLDYPPGATPLDSWTVLSALAPSTSATLAIVTAAVQFRPAAVFAKMAATLQHVSGGRFRCLLGAGADEREHHAYGLPFGSPKERVDVLEDYAAVCRRLWSEDGPVDHDGPSATLAGAVGRPHPPTPIGVGFGGTGPRIVRMAAETGDELCIGLVEDIGPVAARFRNAVAKSSRPVRLSALVPFAAGPTRHPLAAHPRAMTPDATALDPYREAGVETLYLVPLGPSGADAAAAGLASLRAG